MDRKFMLCRYPKNGYGEKNNQFYLLDVFGNTYDIVNEYDKHLDETEKVVRLPHAIFSRPTLNELISAIEEYTNTKIVKW